MINAQEYLGWGFNTNRAGVPLAIKLNFNEILINFKLTVSVYLYLLLEKANGVFK